MLICQVGAGAVARCAQPSHGVGVVAKCPLGIALASVDRGPRGGVDDDVGMCLSTASTGARVADVELRAVEGDDGVAGVRTVAGELSARLPTGARDEHPHQPSPARGLEQLPPAAVMRSVDGLRQPGLEIALDLQPRAVILSISTLHRRSWPSRSGTHSMNDSSRPVSSSSRVVISRLVISL